MVLFQCDPNLYVYRLYGTANNTLRMNRPAVVLVAKRNIKIGEELTFNYQMIFEEDVDDEKDETIETEANKVCT